MSDENQEVVAPTNSDEVVTETTEPVQPVQPESTKVIFDLDDLKVELDRDTVKSLIPFREKYKSTVKKLKELETSAAQFKQKESTLQSTLKFKETEMDNLVAQKVDEAVGKYKNRLVDTELKQALLSVPEFIGGDATNDVVKLLKSENKFELDDNGQIVSGDSKVSDIVSDFIKSKKVYQKAIQSANPFGPGSRTKPAKSTEKLDPLAAIKKGLSALG